MKTIKLICGVIIMLGSFTEAMAQDSTKTKTTTTTTVTTAPAVVMAPPPAPVVVATPVGPNYPQVGTHFGLRFQPTFTSLKSRAYEKNARDVSATVGYGYGVSFNYFFNNYLALQTEFMYSQLKQDYTDQYDASRKVDLSYIDVPILISLNTDYGKRVNLNVCAGPQLGILTGSKFNGNSNGDAAHVDAVVALQTVSVGLGYGAGLDFAMGPRHVTHLNLGFRGVAGNANNMGAYIGLMFKL